MAASSKKDRLNKLREEKILNRRRRNVLIVMIEIVLCLVLAIACYGVTVLNSYHYDELEPDVYKETSDSSVFREKETRIMTSVVEVTNEVGETETSVVEIPIETELSGYRNILCRKSSLVSAVYEIEVILYIVCSDHISFSQCLK